MSVEVKIVQAHLDAKIPKYQTNGASGFDLHATVEAEIPAGGVALVDTGIKVGIPEGYELQVRSRSGLALKSGVFVLNSPGTVDSDYGGNVGVILANFGKVPFKILKGDRVAQGVPRQGGEGCVCRCSCT